MCVYYFVRSMWRAIVNRRPSRHMTDAGGMPTSVVCTVPPTGNASIVIPALTTIISNCHNVLKFMASPPFSSCNKCERNQDQKDTQDRDENRPDLLQSGQWPDFSACRFTGFDTRASQRTEITEAGNAESLLTLCDTRRFIIRRRWNRWWDRKWKRRNGRKWRRRQPLGEKVRRERTVQDCHVMRLPLLPSSHNGCRGNTR